MGTAFAIRTLAVLVCTPVGIQADMTYGKG